MRQRAAWSKQTVGLRFAPIAFPLIAAVLAVTVWAALITLATAAAGFGAATIDLALLALLASQLATAPAKLAAAPIALAATASTTRLILARHAGQRFLASRAALT